MGYEGNPNLFYDIKNTECTVKPLKVILAHELAFKTYFLKEKRRKMTSRKRQNTTNFLIIYTTVLIYLSQLT